MKPHRYAFLALSIAPIALAACGGSAPPPTMQGRQGMLSQTAVAQKCEEAAKGHDRPFVVEWDATDLSSFEAKAARDTIFVKYEGCKLTVLDSCSDPVVAGKLGAYGTPHFTSGTVQGFDVANEGELYAKLPLGAATLSGRVQAGEQLHLKYYVSGVAQNTRDQLYDGELKAYPSCAGATHFVWAYNLGAFELSTSQRTAGEANASLGVAAAGGSSSHDEKSVSGGGKLSACDTQDQRACRVPIRLALRQVSGGNNPIATAPAAGAQAKGDVATTAAGTSAQDQAKALLKNAEDKLEHGDAAGCLDMANKAAGFDIRLVNDRDYKVLRARCTMASGKCDEGKRDFRAALAAADVKRELQDFQLDNEARDEANDWCPSGNTKDPADYIERAFREMKEAAKVKDGKRCSALADALAREKKRLMDPASGVESGRAASVSNLASNGFLLAAQCVTAATHKCSDGAAQMKKECKTVKSSGCEAAMDSVWTSTYKAMKLDCK